MKRKHKGWLLGLSLLVTILVAPTAYADVHYTTNTKDNYGRLVWLQPAYYPIGIIGSDLYVTNPKTKTVSPSLLQNPKDMFIDHHDNIYIADTGNNRIVHLDPNGKLVAFINVQGGKALNKPEGVFVTDQGEIYVADTGNKRVVELDQNGNLLKEYGKPASKYIPPSFKYDPIKVVVDKRGFLYIATLGGYDGLLELDPNGQFQGFFGANDTSFLPIDAIKRALYTKQMYANDITKLPGAINSVAIDKDGFIYTVSGGDVKTDQLKKLNIRGENLLNSTNEFGKAKSKPYGEYKPSDFKIDNGVPRFPQLIDVAVDNNGNMAAIDSQYKYINQYDSVGDLLYFWGGPSSSSSTLIGRLKEPVAIDFNSNNDLYVLDEQENIIQAFRLSEFGKLVEKADQLTLAGRYVESKGLWQRIIKLNAHFSPAYEGLAKAAYKEGQYGDAAALFKKAGNQVGYSDAKWQIRLLWFQKYFSWLATSFLGGIILLLLLQKLTKNSSLRRKWRSRRRTRIPILVQLKHALTILRHPIEGFIDIRFESKGSYWSAVLILFAAAGAVVFQQFYTNFSFNKVIVSEINVSGLVGRFFLFWGVWVVANHLISSVYRGEGRFRDVFIGSAYALVPLIIVGVPLSVFSNAMTLSESSIYHFLYEGMMIWVGLLLYWMVQSLQNYSIGETILNIAMSLFTMFMIGVLAFIIGGLSSDFYTFLHEVYQEVRMR